MPDDAHRVETPGRPPRRHHAQAAASELAVARDAAAIAGVWHRMPRLAGESDSSTWERGKLPECPGQVAQQKQAVPCEWIERTRSALSGWLRVGIGNVAHEE